MGAAKALWQTERFWPKVNVRGSDECWEWAAVKSSSGYGLFRLRGRMVAAHRLSWEMANDGPIPAGMHVCHACDNRVCVNPAHLWIGTASDNAIDRSNKGRHAKQRLTHCPHGHAYDAANTYLWSGWRACKACRRGNVAEHRRRQREASHA